MKGSGFLLILLLCLTSILHPLSAYTQISERSPSFFSINYRSGENKPHREVIKNLTYPYRGVDVKLGWQSLGNKQWQQAFRYPSYGIGLNWNTFKTDILGEPFALYFFTSFPQLTTRYTRLDLEVNFGISYGINPYDEISNPNNFSTGSSTNAYFGLYLEQAVDLGQHTDLFVSAGFTHYSNGALGYPNLGLNIPSLKAGIRYQPVYKEKIHPFSKAEFTPQWELLTFVGGGTRKWKTESVNDYRQLVLSPAIYYRPAYKRRVGVGYELAFNESIRIVKGKEDYRGQQLLTHAVFAAHEFIIERFTIATQFGIYLYNMPSDKFYYERVGIAFHLTPWAKMVLNVKAHYFKAEYVETGLVFDLNIK